VRIGQIHNGHHEGNNANGCNATTVFFCMPRTRPKHYTANNNILQSCHWHRNGQTELRKHEQQYWRNVRRPAGILIYDERGSLSVSDGDILDHGVEGMTRETCIKIQSFVRLVRSLAAATARDYLNTSSTWISQSVIAVVKYCRKFECKLKRHCQNKTVTLFSSEIKHD